MLVDPHFWAGRRVFLTGHTGFKGAWLALWLTELGAKVTGMALPAEEPSLFNQAGLGKLVTSIEGDIRDAALVERVITEAQPEVVFHLAAQPLVRLSYDEPCETFATNVQGTAHVLDACRRVPGLKAIVSVTSDKCYDNREWVWPYRETDALGGHDPYSASKAAAEIVIASWRKSFFSDPAGPLLASVRAGNVIGGGDWAKDRLVPDIVRAVGAGQPVIIRSPGALRPWQHVFEALGGYLLIAQRLAAGDTSIASAWNFGPVPGDTRPVLWIVKRMIERWGRGSYQIVEDHTKHEATLLTLDCSKAQAALGWRASFNLGTTIDRIIDWHQAVADGADALTISREQLAAYQALMNATLSEESELA
ncbi:CDP-glucose 4,6-dehydratase [Porphyrobacter sp. TH134]|uniref:CDP-glucose 4,6-dehydratase n=1 Tax=Porphyrobacter sp. TH134 TaxID=2067450 RepID=UPI000C7B9A56|nr:CDP-glucose 4,6-dehydratase [Porphyrobacter sp. TH134]PLK22487.1 CDP-glucose 4,6-dehydratase [Porphyrobacter sp. TH134]